MLPRNSDPGQRSERLLHRLFQLSVYRRQRRLLRPAVSDFLVLPTRDDVPHPGPWVCGCHRAFRADADRWRPLQCAGGVCGERTCARAGTVPRYDCHDGFSAAGARPLCSAAFSPGALSFFGISTTSAPVPKASFAFRRLVSVADFEFSRCIASGWCASDRRE